ncbi:hypothetical protein C8R43DRAFT_842705, partial [Mycena crocata]
NRKIWRLGPLNGDGTVEDELVLHIQGLVTKLGLTPGSIAHLPAAKASQLSQSITITGGTSETFQAGLASLQTILDLFLRNFQNGVSTKWAAINDTDEPIISASNRFFTAIKDEPRAEHVAFGPGVDPIEQLRAFVGPALVHAEDNVVSYFKTASASLTEDVVYETAVPSTFRIGDVVEIQMSVIAFQGGKDTFKLHCHLRALTLLDSTFS